MRAVVSKLAADYKAKYKVDPDTFIGHPLDALTLIEEAVKKAGSTDREKLAKAMASGIRFPGANGMYNFTADNHAGLDSSSESMIMVKIQGGRFVVVK
jgi:branched-chain amino acid transport system substrate-binding protein